MEDTMYQKMISYIYEYIQEEKGANIGFVKLALQNHQYKMKIHLKNMCLNGKNMMIYGFVRKDAKLHTIPFGTIKVMSGIGEGLFLGSTEELFSEYRFLDMGGLLIIPEESITELSRCRERFLATQWDNRVLSIKETDLFQKKGELQAAEFLSEGEVTREGQNDFLCEAENINSSYEQLPGENYLEESERKEQTDKIRNLKRDYKQNLETKKVENDKNRTENYNSEEKKTKQLEAAGVLQKEEQEGKSIWDLFEERRNKMHQRFEKIENIQGSALEKEEGKNKEQNKTGRKNIEAENIEVENIETRNMDIENIDTEKKETENKEENKESRIWQEGERILKNYTPMCPFFDQQVLASVRMEPKDIGVFPMEHWYLANNSFLLHGYYCYRHLLFMKMKKETGNLYAIGVPGNGHYKEQFMAKMFGFEDFKPVQKKENAGFGYWWKKIYE